MQQITFIQERQSRDRAREAFIACEQQRQAFYEKERAAIIAKAIDRDRSVVVAVLHRFRHGELKLTSKLRLSAAQRVLLYLLLVCEQLSDQAQVDFDLSNVALSLYGSYLIRVRDGKQRGSIFRTAFAAVEQWDSMSELLHAAKASVGFDLTKLRESIAQKSIRSKSTTLLWQELDKLIIDIETVYPSLVHSLTPSSQNKMSYLFLLQNSLTLSIGLTALAMGIIGASALATGGMSLALGFALLEITAGALATMNSAHSLHQYLSTGDLRRADQHLLGDAEPIATTLECIIATRAVAQLAFKSTKVVDSMRKQKAFRDLLYDQKKFILGVRTSFKSANRSLERSADTFIRKINFEEEVAQNLSQMLAFYRSTKQLNARLGVADQLVEATLALNTLNEKGFNFQSAATLSIAAADATKHGILKNKKTQAPQRSKFNSSRVHLIDLVRDALTSAKKMEKWD